MNPKSLSVRVDRHTGDLWLTEEKYRKPPRKIANITAHVLLALSAELTAEDGSDSLTREVKFSDDMVIRVTVQMVNQATGPDDPLRPE